MVRKVEEEEVMEDVKSLAHKMEELGVLLKTNHDCQELSAVFHQVMAAAYLLHYKYSTSVYSC